MAFTWGDFKFRNPDLWFDDVPAGTPYQTVLRGLKYISGSDVKTLFPQDRVYFAGNPDDLFVVGRFVPRGPWGDNAFYLKDGMPVDVPHGTAVYKAFGFSKPIPLHVTATLKYGYGETPDASLVLGLVAGYIFVRNIEFEDEITGTTHILNYWDENEFHKGTTLYAMTPEAVPATIVRTYTEEDLNHPGSWRYCFEVEAVVPPTYYCGVGRYTIPLTFVAVFPTEETPQTITKTFSYRISPNCIMTQPMPDPSQNGAVFSIMVLLENLEPNALYELTVGKLINTAYSQEYTGTVTTIMTPYNFDYPYAP